MVFSEGGLKRCKIGPALDEEDGRRVSKDIGLHGRAVRCVKFGSGMASGVLKEASSDRWCK